MKYIDSEIILQRKIGGMIYVYIMIIFVIILSLIIFFILFHYETYYTARGTVVEEDNHYYIRTYISLENLQYITDREFVIIDKIKYKYDITSIDNEYFTDNITTFQVVKIEIKIPEKYKFNNLTLSLNFIKENKRVIDYIIK